jgi:2-polyprenyl-3-methyl-5-hydroxy-6-metoxy-1,4-benzoquinol methylase/rubredoxin
MIDTAILPEGRVCPNCARKEHVLKFYVSPFRVVECSNCSLVYLHNPPSEDILYEGYHDIEPPDPAQYRENSTTGSLRELFAINQQRIKVLKALRPDGRLLDVGCGRGYFLKTAGENGYRPYGIDISETAVQYAKESFGVEAVKQDAHELLLSDQRFDVITAWHVLEHFLDPLKVLNMFRQLLTKDGICFIEVPNLKSLKFILLRDKWQGGNHPLYHRTFFTGKTLRRMLVDAQFSRVNRATLTYYLPGRWRAYEAAKAILNQIAMDAFLDFVVYK